MPTASHVVIPLASINNQTMGGTGLAVMAVVIVVSHGVWLALVFLAARHPGTKQPTPTVPRTGPVIGGMHAGDGRSVAPHRDEPAEPGSDADRR